MPRRLSTVDAAGYADASSALMAVVACLQGGPWAPGAAPARLPGPVVAIGTSPLGVNWVVVLGP